MRIAAIEALSRSAPAATSIRRKRTCACSILILVFLCHGAASSISLPHGQLAGTVVDQAGASVFGAEVVLGVAGAEAHRSTTNQQGRSLIERVFAGDYIVSVHKVGFRQARRVLHLAPGESLLLRFQLNVATISESVTVTTARGPQQLFQVGIDGAGVNAAIRCSFKF